ncbi:MAG: hypothetical protein CL676_01830 [Bdellovibrionaceae bacterium]|nr:hypothetical protein [Pseudobdellovibrionaceae bacterium]
MKSLAKISSKDTLTFKNFYGKRFKSPVTSPFRHKIQKRYRPYSLAKSFAGAVLRSRKSVNIIFKSQKFHQHIIRPKILIFRHI